MNLKSFLPLLFVALSTFGIGSSFGQAPPYSVQIFPSAPTSADSIIVQIGIERTCIATATMSFPATNNIRIDLTGNVCFPLPQGDLQVSVGALALGSYVVDVFAEGVPAGSIVFSVTALQGAAVPVMSDAALLILVIVIFIIGLRRSGRSLLRWS